MKKHVKFLEMVASIPLRLNMLLISEASKPVALLRFSVVQDGKKLWVASMA